MPSTKALILEAVRNLTTANHTFVTILSQIWLLASQLPEYSVVSAINSVGKCLHIFLIAELGDVRRFHRGSTLIAHAGLDAPPYQSGTFDGSNATFQSVGSFVLR